MNGAHENRSEAEHGRGSSEGTGYLLSNSDRQARNRLEAISTLFDETTLRHMRALGLGTGWRCWEIGAGGPTVPLLLAREVGPDGMIIATDIDVIWAEAASSSNVRIIKHDVVMEAAPEGPFDLIHARLVLVHLPERAEVLGRIAAALKPGGWLLVEDADPNLQPLACVDESGPAQALANKLRRGFRTLMADRGVDLEYGRSLPRALRDAGLRDVMAEAFFPLARPECSALEIATITMLREQMISKGLASENEVKECVHNLQHSALDIATAPMISAWGRRPSP